MAWTILYSITDEKAKVSTTEVKLPSATTHADVVIFAQEMVSLIDPLITGAVTRIGITQEVSLPSGLAASASANSDVEKGAKFESPCARDRFRAYFSSSVGRQSFSLLSKGK
jgi:hypothetical protein